MLTPNRQHKYKCGSFPAHSFSGANSQAVARVWRRLFSWTGLHRTNKSAVGFKPKSYSISGNKTKARSYAK
jgi:hypothetical protein